MAQPPFSGNDFFDQIDSVARNLTGNAFRLKRDDPDAPQKFTEFVAQSEQEFNATQPIPQAAQPTQTFQDFERGGFVSPEVAEARLQDPDWVASQTQPTFAGNEGAPGPAGMALQALQNITAFGAGQFSDLTGIAPQEFRDAAAAERAKINAVEANNPFERFAQSIEGNFFAPSKAFRQTISDYPQIGVTQGAVDAAGNLLNTALPVVGFPLDIATADPENPEAAQFHVGTGDLLEAVTDPFNFAGPGSFALKGAGSRVVTGAGKKALSAAEQAAEAIGRTGVPNVLDTVPPQTVAGRAARAAGGVPDFRRGANVGNDEIPPAMMRIFKESPGADGATLSRAEQIELRDFLREKGTDFNSSPSIGGIIRGTFDRSYGGDPQIYVGSFKMGEAGLPQYVVWNPSKGKFRTHGTAPDATQIRTTRARIKNFGIENVMGRPHASADETIEIFGEDIPQSGLRPSTPALTPPTTPATGRAARGAGVDLDEKLTAASGQVKAAYGSPQSMLEMGEEYPRYWYHYRVAPVAEDGGINATRIREPEAADMFGANYAEGEYIWLSPTPIRSLEDSLIVDISKLTNNDIRSTGQFEGNILHRGNIPKSAIVEAPTTPARGRAAAARGAGGVPTARTIKFIRNPEKAPDVGARFGQDVEPAGRYVTEATDADIARIDVQEGRPRFESGEVTFENPLEIPFGEGYESANNWKRVLSERYQATGEELSQKIADDGFDGIITTLPDGTTSEIVDLTSFRQAPTTPPTGTAAAARQVTPQQQAIIDDVGTGALPADDVAVDALDAAPVARAADDASLRAIEDAQASRASGTAGGSGPPAIRNRPTADASFPEGSRTAVFQPASSVPWKDDPLIQRAVKVIRETKTLQPESAAALSRGRKRQIARGGQGARTAETFSEVGPAFKRELGGEIQRPEFEPIKDLFSPEELNELRSRIWGRGSVLEFADQPPGYTNWRQFNASEAFDRLFHPDSAVLPTPSEQALLERVFGPELVRAVKSKKARGQKAWDIAMDIWNLPRAMLATGDISATARQAGLLGPGNPKQFKDAFISQLKAFAHEEYALASREAIEASPNFLRFTTKTGSPSDAFSTANRRLHISQIGESAERGSREEIFLTSIAGRLPIMKNSERAFVTILNELRFSVMERMVDAAELANRSDAIAKGIPGSGTTPISAKSIALAREVGTHEDILNIVAHRLDIEKLPAGLTPQEHALEIANDVGGATDQQLDAIAAYINYSTGRGSLGKAEGAAPLLNGLLFSPRLAISRFQLPLSVLTRAPNVRKKIAMDLVKYAGGMSLFLWLADNSPGGHIDVTANPFSSDVGKMRIGKTRFDFGAGTLQAIRFVSQIATGKRVATGTRSVSKTHPFNPEIASRFLRSKAHPSLGLVLDVGNREDFLGEDFLLDAESFKDFDVTEGALRKNPLLRTFTFMWIQDVVEAWKESGPIVGALAIPAAVGGVGASSFSTSDDTSIELWGKPITDVWPFQQGLAKELFARTSDRGPSAFDQVDIDRYDALQDILVQLEEGMIDKRTAVNRYFSINTFYSGLRKGLSAGIFGGNPSEEAVFPETPSGGTEAEKAALQEYYDSSTPFESKSGFNSDEWAKVLKVLERKWRKDGTLEYVLANTHTKPVPQNLLDILPDKTKVTIKRSNDARARFLKSEGQEEPDIEFGSEGSAPAPIPTPAPIPQATPGSGYLWELQPPAPK